MYLTRHRSHEVALSDLLADGVKHLRVVADVVELGVILDVSDVDGSAVGLGKVSRSRVPLETVVSLGANGQDVGGIKGGDIVAVDDVDAHVEDSVGGVQLEELGTGADRVVIHLLSEIEYSAATVNGIFHTG